MVLEDYFDPYSDPESDRDGGGVTCKFCNAGGLSWEDNGSGPRLYDENHKRHVCHRGNKPTPNDFDDLT